jgi:hypothetical protein
MRWVLPGGAVLCGSNRGDDERSVACRPRAAVLERTSPRWPAVPAQTEVSPPPAAEPPPDPPPKEPTERLFTTKPEVKEQVVSKPSTQKPVGRLSTMKLWLEVLALLVGLIGAILALFGGLRK